MTELYLPPSDFLQSFIQDEGPLLGSNAETSVRLLIELTRDADVANRDWATLLLAQQEIDTAEVRSAFLAAAEDENEYVRAEAILGLARRDRNLALPLLHRELAADQVALPLFEAAALVADASLVEALREFIRPSGDDSLDELAMKALQACEAVS